MVHMLKKMDLKFWWKFLLTFADYFVWRIYHLVVYCWRLKRQTGLLDTVGVCQDAVLTFRETTNSTVISFWRFERQDGAAGSCWWERGPRRAWKERTHRTRGTERRSRSSRASWAEGRPRRPRGPRTAWRVQMWEYCTQIRLFCGHHNQLPGRKTTYYI